MNGHLEILKWTRDNGYWNELTYSAAASKGHDI
jgi:hypothetical protein